MNHENTKARKKPDIFPWQDLFSPWKLCHKSPNPSFRTSPPKRARSVVRQAVRQAYGPEQGRRTHGPEQGRRTHGPEHSRRTHHPERSRGGIQMIFFVFSLCSMPFSYWLLTPHQYCGSGFPRPPRLKPRDGGQAAATRHSGICRRRISGIQGSRLAVSPSLRVAPPCLVLSS
jgi:hypothetical protein